MYDKIKVKKDSIGVHGVPPPAVPHIADMWERDYVGRVINNLNVSPVNIHYFDNIVKDYLRISERAMDMAVEMGYDTMEISKVHKGKSHSYFATDLYFYNSDEE
jgi:hypothetical protein